MEKPDPDGISIRAEPEPAFDFIESQPLQLGQRHRVHKMPSPPLERPVDPHQCTDFPACSAMS